MSDKHWGILSRSGGSETNPAVIVPPELLFGYFNKADCGCWSSEGHEVLFGRTSAKAEELASRGFQGHPSQVVIPVPYASATHFKITRISAGNFLLTDLSRNGTLVNGKTLGTNNTITLRPGDRVGLQFKSETKVEYTFGDREVASAGTGAGTGHIFGAIETSQLWSDHDARASGGAGTGAGGGGGVPARLTPTGSNPAPSSLSSLSASSAAAAGQPHIALASGAAATAGMAGAGAAAQSRESQNHQSQWDTVLLGQLQQYEMKGRAMAEEFAALSEKAGLLEAQLAAEQQARTAERAAAVSDALKATAERERLLEEHRVQLLDATSAAAAESARCQDLSAKLEAQQRASVEHAARAKASSAQVAKLEAQLEDQAGMLHGAREGFMTGKVKNEAARARLDELEAVIARLQTANAALQDQLEGKEHEWARRDKQNQHALAMTQANAASVAGILETLASSILPRFMADAMQAVQGGQGALADMAGSFEGFALQHQQVQQQQQNQSVGGGGGGAPATVLSAPSPRHSPRVVDTYTQASELPSDSPRVGGAGAGAGAVRQEQEQRELQVQRMQEEEEEDEDEDEDERGGRYVPKYRNASARVAVVTAAEAAAAAASQSQSQVKSQVRSQARSLSQTRKQRRSSEAGGSSAEEGSPSPSPAASSSLSPSSRIKREGAGEGDVDADADAVGSGVDDGQGEPAPSWASQGRSRSLSQSQSQSQQSQEYAGRAGKGGKSGGGSISAKRYRSQE